MSTFVDTAINPQTNEPQKALFIDDHYGSHQYGVGFKNDGTEPSILEKIVLSDYTIYPLEDIKTTTEDPGEDILQS